MPEPTYVDPVAEKLRSAVRKISSEFEAGLGLEPEVSFGTRTRGKRYGMISLATSPIETGDREGVITGYQRYKLSMNYQFITVVENQAPPGQAVSSISYINGEMAYYVQTFRGFVDNLNSVVDGGDGVAELRVESLDSIYSQQTKPPRDYELFIVGQLSVYYYVKKGLYGQPVTAIEPTFPYSVP